MSAESAALEKQNRDLEKNNKELRKDNKELKTHNKFLEDRLEKWADKNFDLRQELNQGNKKIPDGKA
jgi:septal ring factor EnvC (AmiA/AmiB activator)